MPQHNNSNHTAEHTTSNTDQTIQHKAHHAQADNQMDIHTHATAPGGIPHIIKAQSFQLHEAGEEVMHFDSVCLHAWSQGAFVFVDWKCTLCFQIR